MIFQYCGKPILKYEEVETEEGCLYFPCPEYVAPCLKKFQGYSFSINCYGRIMIGDGKKFDGYILWYKELRNYILN